MKKAINHMILTVMFAGLLSGCGAGDSDKVQDVSGADSQEISAGSQEISADNQEISAEGGTMDPFAVMNLSFKDNSMDAYSLVERAALQTGQPENAREEDGRGRSVLGATGAYRFKKHLLPTAGESWDEVLFVTGEGKAGSERYEVKDQLWDIGSAVGTDHYVTLSLDEQENGEDRSFFLTEKDENHEPLRKFPLDFLNGDVHEAFTISDFLVDQSGTAHLVKGKYMLVSQEGEILAEYAPEEGQIKRLVPLYDGRIALEIAAKGKDGERTLQYIDDETGSPVTLAALKGDFFVLRSLTKTPCCMRTGKGCTAAGCQGRIRRCFTVGSTMVS